jgi:hypothetical protein
MKKTIVFAALAALVALSLPVAASPAAGSWTGWITDSHCGAAGAKADHTACALKCAKGGSSLLLYNTGDKKLYKLDKQDLAQNNLGYEVTVKGKVDGDKIAVDSIAKAAAH